MARLSQWAQPVAAPLLRIALAVPFFRSGLTRWEGFLSLSPSTTYLFAEEFKLHLFGGAYALPVPALMAHITAVAEITLPVLLVVGLATRLAALGLLGMIGVIQLIVPGGWADFHLPWAAIAIAIIALGPGKLSLDHIVDRRVSAQRAGA
jgi:putative oxidoreductase